MAAPRPSKILSDAVTSPDDGETWTFQCPGVVGQKCDDVNGNNFSSSGWPTKKTALARGQEHLDEHKHGPALASLRGEIDMARNNDPGYEDVKPEDKEREFHELLSTARMSSLDDFRAKHGLAVVTDADGNGKAVKVEDL